MFRDIGQWDKLRTLFRHLLRKEQEQAADGRWEAPTHRVLQLMHPTATSRCAPLLDPPRGTFTLQYESNGVKRYPARNRTCDVSRLITLKVRW